MNRREALPIVHIGPLPPPYGGVSVHVRRLASLLTASGLRVVVCCKPGSDPVPDVETVGLEDFSWRGLLSSGGHLLDARVVHCHEGWEWSPALLAAAIRGARVVVTVHSETQMESLGRLAWHLRLAARMLVACPRVRWIAVSERLRDELVGLGVRESRVQRAPAYLPVGSDGAPPPPLPKVLREFVGSHDPLMTVYGWRVNQTTEGEDLYGFDLAIEAAGRLRAMLPGCGLVVLVPSGEPSDGVRALQGAIDERGLQDSVRVWCSPVEDPRSLWEATDVYIRPSRSDGDAVSVREVLAEGGTVVASDCVRRPAGARTFRSGDPEALAEAIHEALEETSVRGQPDADVRGAVSAIAQAYGLAPDALLRHVP